MIELKSGKINARDLHKSLESNASFSTWIKKKILDIGLIKDKDFTTSELKSPLGRPSIEFEITLDAAKEICIIQNTEKGRELRRYLIKLSDQRDNLELITVKESVFATKVVNCLKYIENQKLSLKLHSADYFKTNENPTSQQFAEFNTYRSKIVGWNKEKVNMAIDEYLQTHSGHNRNVLMKSNMQTQLSVMDIGEAIRVAVLDVLYSKNENEYDAARFSDLCKRIANEMEVQPEKENKANLFRNKEVIGSVNDIKLLK